MIEKSWDFLAEFRHWRASFPVGVTIGFTLALLLTDQWPSLTNPASYPENHRSIIELLGRPGLIVIGLVGCSLLGAWWSLITFEFVMRVQAWIISRLPLDRVWDSWPWIARAVCLVPKGAISEIQKAMIRSQEYRDLEEGDRRGAFVSVFREAASTPYAEGVSDQWTTEIIRSRTDIRLVSGLIPWLPALLAIFLGQLQITLGTLPAFLSLIAPVTAVLLVVNVVLHVRRANKLAVERAIGSEFLHRHARDAINSGRTEAEVRAALEATE